MRLFKILSVAFLMLLTLPFSLANADEKLKVGFVYVGPVGDHGWTYMHDQGRLLVESELGDKVSTVYVENVKYGPDAERVMRQMDLNLELILFLQLLSVTWSPC